MLYKGTLHQLLLSCVHSSAAVAEFGLLCLYCLKEMCGYFAISYSVLYLKTATTVLIVLVLTCSKLL